MSRETPLELFREACGLAEPLALASGSVDSANVPPTTFETPAPFLFIGRHRDDDMYLDDRRVSRRHAYVQAVAGQVVCIDLRSRTGTFWGDGPEVRPWGWLESDQSIRIGPYRIRRTDRQPGEPAGAAPVDPFAPPEDGRPDTDGWPQPVLELPIRVGGVAPIWEMRGLLALVGRADDCQLTLTDDSISRTHACLIRTPQGAWVVDLGAREGVHVNGTRVRWAWLDDGDVARFGLFTMVVRYDRRPDGILRQDVPIEAGAFPADARPREPASADESRTELVISPRPRPPGLRSAAAPPRIVDPVIAPVATGAEWEPTPSPGANAFAIWQQQMQLMETFHNDMAMMVQMFIAMHREFKSSVREELARVQQLTRELGRLNVQLGQVPRSTGAGESPGVAASEPKARPAPRPARAGRDGSPGADAARTADPPPASPRKGRKDPARSAARPPAASGDREQPAAPRPAPRMESSEMYADLTRRITQLQRERRGYWQRILKSING